MKKTIAVLSIATIGLSSAVLAQDRRRDPRDPRNRNSCEQQLATFKQRLQTLQQRNIIIDNERKQCVSDLQQTRQAQSMIRMNLNRCEADLADARRNGHDRGIIMQLRRDLKQCTDDLDASRNRPGNGHEVRRLRMENERLITDNTALQAENQQLRVRIYQLERELDDLRNPPIPMAEYAAECHIDDDPGLTFDQFNMGVLRGSLEQIMNDCKSIAVSQYGRNSSQGFKTVKFEGDTFGKTSAECHVDDDPGLTYDQFVVGRLYGNTLQDVIAQCRSLAQFNWGSNSSSGIRDVRTH